MIFKNVCINVICVYINAFFSFRENGDLSPNTVDNDSCKSTEAELDYPNLRRGSCNKVSPYSEEGKRTCQIISISIY